MLRHALTGVLVLATAGPLAARTEVAASPAAHLLLPASGMTLIAGSEEGFFWSPTSDLCGEIVEWEVFLSVDGGKSYPFRITPHLDLDIRRIAWRVPDLQTGDARFLLRLGNEHKEVAVELPGRFRIEVPRFSIKMAEFLASISGEAARPGEPGVAVWTEGTRRGARLRTVHTFASKAALPQLSEPDEWLLPAEGSDEVPSVLPTPLGTHELAPRARSTDRPTISSKPFPVVDIRLATKRQNE